MSTRLTPRNAMMMVVFGAVLWFGAAMLLRTLVPMGALTAEWRMITYGLIIPGTFPFVWLAQRITGAALPAVAVATAAATLLDGVALGWFPTLYGTDPLAAAAAILWGGGVGLALAWLIDR